MDNLGIKLGEICKHERLEALRDNGRRLGELGEMFGSCQAWPPEDKRKTARAVLADVCAVGGDGGRCAAGGSADGDGDQLMGVLPEVIS